jgi:hypothetical protein
LKYQKRVHSRLDTSSHTPIYFILSEHLTAKRKRVPDNHWYLAHYLPANGTMRPSFLVIKHNLQIQMVMIVDNKSTKACIDILGACVQRI